jgi:hypothetical protein
MELLFTCIELYGYYINKCLDMKVHVSSSKRGYQILKQATQCPVLLMNIKDAIICHIFVVVQDVF